MSDKNELPWCKHGINKTGHCADCKVDSLITTIESQKEEIAKWKINSSEYENLLNRQIESLKAITELAVKAIGRVIEGDFIYLTAQRQYLKNTLSEIERLGKVIDK